MVLLRLLAASGRRGSPLTELSRQTCLPHSTVHRLLKQLIDERLAIQLEETRRYALGPMCFELGVAAYPYDLRTISRPLLEQLAVHADDSVFFSMRSADEAVCIDLQPGPSPIRVVTLEIGTRRPLGVGAGGLAILAALPGDERVDVLERVMPLLVKDWGISAVSLQESMLLVQNKGYALIRNRVHAGISAMGHPIYSALGHPIAALSIAALNERFTESRMSRLADLLRQAAKQFEQKMQGIPMMGRL